MQYEQYRMSAIRRYIPLLLAAAAGFLLPSILPPQWSAVQHAGFAILLGMIGICTYLGYTLVLDHRLLSRARQIGTIAAAKVLVMLFLLPLIALTTVSLYQDTIGQHSVGTAHWHADFQVIIDGEEYSFIDHDKYCDGTLCPYRVGTRQIHAHDDQRIHVEGKVTNLSTVTLGAFFRTFGGKISATELRYLTNDGWINRTETANKTLNVFVKRGQENNRGWEHVPDPANYLMSPVYEGDVDKIRIVYGSRSMEETLHEPRKYK